MVKDEVDIIEYWIQYHGSIFGYHNLYIVDNLSTDGTLDIIKKYVAKGVKLYHETDYKRKGDDMTKLIHDPSIGKYDIAFPIDIDEFIVHYDKVTNKISASAVYAYMKTLVPDNTHMFRTDHVFKANFIQSKITLNNPNGYVNAVLEAKCGVYADKKDRAKTFFNKHTWKGIVDHGNHYPTNNYILTDICLVHYHHRSLHQHKQKVINNVKGLGYDDTNLAALKSFPTTSMGAHHIRHMIRILENTYRLPTNYKPKPEDIDLQPLSEYIRKIQSEK